MRRLVLACALAIAWAVPAFGQEPPAPATPTERPLPNAADIGRWIEEAERFKEVCSKMSSREVDERFRADPRDKSPVARANRLFIGAVARFCAYGDFVLTGAENNKCEQKIVLTEDHRAFLRQLSTVREKSIHRVDLECVDFAGNFFIERIEAGSLRLRDVSAGRIVIVASKFSGEISILNAEVRADIALTQIESGSTLRIGEKTNIANQPRWTYPLEIRDSTFRSVFITDTVSQGSATLSGLEVKGNLEILRSKLVKGTLRGIGIKVGGALIVINSDLDGNADFSNAHIDRVSFTQARFGAELTMHGLQAEQNVGFWDKSSVTGKVNARGMKIGGALIVSGSTLSDATDFDHIHADRIGISSSTIGGDLSFRYAQLSSRAVLDAKSSFQGFVNGLGARFGSALVIDDATFAKYVRLDYTEAERVTVEDATFENTFDIEYAKMSAVSIDKTTIKRTFLADYARIGALLTENSTIAPSGCEGGSCRFGLFNSSVDHFRIRGVKSRRLDAGNARFRVLLASGDTDVEWFVCADCVVEQFALVAGRVTKSASFAGAEFKGTLAFSENRAQARWGAEAMLDLSELRADTISANACDLMLEQKDGDKSIPCAEQNADKRQFVPTRLTGARYRAIVPGRQLALDVERPAPPPANSPPGADMKGAAMAAQPPPRRTDGDRIALLDLPPEQIIRFVASSKPNYHDPQPYEEMADVLTRAGKNIESIDIRVARINDRLERVETNPFIQLWYWIYYYVSHYGFKNWRAFVYFLGLIAVGAVIYHYGMRKDAVPVEGAEQNVGTRALYSVWFSLDRAVPPLRLDPKLEEELHLTPWVRQYFYLHRVAGAILISVFAAGLAGLGH